MSEQLYRQCLKEKLLDLSGELKTGRNSLTVNSGLYNSLDKSINDVIKVLEAHEGEEALSPEVRTDLENKLGLMKQNARPYAELKLRQGALAQPGLTASPAERERLNNTRTRYFAANDLLKIDTKLPANPGEYEGIIAPQQLEPGDHPETDWRLKWKQNVRYLARKQIQTYERRKAHAQAAGELSQDDFNTLMDLTTKKNLLQYKNDAELCQKYPGLRLSIDKAQWAAEKLPNLSENDFNRYLREWKSHSMEKAAEAAEKAAKRRGKPFTEKDRKKLEEKHELFINDHLEKYGSIQKLGAAGDVLEQIGRFADLKMKVISNRNYVKLLYTNTLGKLYSTSDYEMLEKKSRDPNEKEFYRNLRDIRELEDAGIEHIRPAGGIDTAFYRNVDETLNRTVKKDFLSFRSGTPGFAGASANNSSFGATEDSTSNRMQIAQDSKLRIGKIGLKLHSKHKNLQVSGGLAFGQAKASTVLGASLNELGGQALLYGEASALRARIKAGAKFKDYNLGISGGASASVGFASGYANAGMGNITVMGIDGKPKQRFGLSAGIGGVAAVVRGSVGGTLNLFGVKVGMSFTSYVGGVGSEIGGHLTTGSAGLSLGGALGLGIGLKLSIDWSEAWKNLKASWKNSKLMTLINKYKERKALRKQQQKEQEKASFDKAKENIKEGAPKKNNAKAEGEKKNALSEQDDFNLNSKNRPVLQP